MSLLKAKIFINEIPNIIKIYNEVNIKKINDLNAFINDYIYHLSKVINIEM